MAQGKTAEDGVQSVEKSGSQPQQQALPRQAGLAAPGARHTGAAKEGEPQGEKLALCDLVPPQQGGQQHHKGGGGIEQNGGHRQGALLLAAEIAPGEEHHTHHSSAEKPPQMLSLHPEGLPLPHRQHQSQHHKAAQVAHQHDALRP